MTSKEPTGELTLSIIDESMKQLPLRTYPKRMRVSPHDYQKLREVCDIFGIIPEQIGGFTYGFFGEQIIADAQISDGCFEYDWE